MTEECITSPFRRMIGSLALSINPSMDDRDNYPPPCADDSLRITRGANWSGFIG
jgi:hypothetical protein